MTFVSLVLIQFFKAYNFRSDRHSVLHRPFANRWLNLAIVWELALLLVVVYVPFLHRAVRHDRPLRPGLDDRRRRRLDDPAGARGGEVAGAPRRLRRAGLAPGDRPLASRPAEWTRAAPVYVMFRIR